MKGFKFFCMKAKMPVIRLKIGVVKLRASVITGTASRNVKNYGFKSYMNLLIFLVHYVPT